MKYELNFSTSYHQFYISDKKSSQDTGDINFWTKDATQSRLAIGDGILGVALECYGRFKGQLILLDKKNEQVELLQVLGQCDLHVVAGHHYGALSCR